MAEWVDNSEVPEDFIGVVPIFRPAARARGRIFAFHGIEGSWRKTWTQNNVFWLRDLLPTKFPHCEICSVGWGTQLSGEPPAKTISDYMSKTPLDRRAPVVFIVHSISFFDEAMRYLYGLERIIPVGEPFRSCTPELDQLKGIIYLGTPHRMDRSPEDYLAFFQPETYYIRHFLDDFKRKTSNTAQTDSSFNTLVQKRSVKIFSIYQQQEPHEQNDNDIVFSKSESIIGSLKRPSTVTNLADESLDLERVIGVLKSHFDLARFASATEQSFLDLCTWLEDIFGSLIKHDISWDMLLIPLAAHRPTLADQNRLYDIVMGNSYDHSHRWSQLVRSNGSKYQDKWYHFPANFESEMMKAFETIGDLHRYFEPPDKPFRLGEVRRAHTDYPHARYVLPSASCFSTDEKQSGYSKEHAIFFRIILPYLHWDTKFGSKGYCSWLKREEKERTLNPDPLPAFISLPEPIRSYHPRRTLDQFYYSRLENTDDRDDDQIVSKQTEKDPSGAKMIVVDQLWLGLWLSKDESFHVYKAPTVKKEGEDESEGTATVLTAFPDSTYARPGVLSREDYRRVDIRQRAFDALEMKAKNIGQFGEGKPGQKETFGATDVAAEIISAALLDMMSFREDWTLHFMELFRRTLEQINEQHSRQFRHFATFIRNKSPGDKGKGKDNDPDGAAKLEDEKLMEIGLSLEVADVIDELNMLRKLFQEQINVLGTACKELRKVEVNSHFAKQHLFGPLPDRLLEPFRDRLQKLSAKVEEDYLAQIESMMKDAERAQKDISILLDLYQKEESIRGVRENARQAKENVRQTMSLNQQALFSAKQAISAQQQAAATDAQNQILFIFTTITIVFLPLSFITSYYGSNVRTTDNEQMLWKSSYVNKVLFATSGSITLSLSLGGLIWFFVSKKRAENDRIEEFAKLMKTGDLPPRLLELNDPLLGKVEARVGEMQKSDKNVACTP